jgi:hypothetical protein
MQIQTRGSKQRKVIGAENAMRIKRIKYLLEKQDNIVQSNNEYMLHEWNHSQFIPSAVLTMFLKRII